MPTVTIQGPGSVIDTYISASGSQSENYGTNTALQTAGPASTARALLRFNLSAIPNNATIVSATLRMYKSVGSGGVNVGAHRALTQWYEGNQTGTTPTINGSTWQYRNHIGSVAWGAAGGQSGTDYATTATSTVALGANGSHDWNVTSDVTSFLNGTNTNFGWWLVQASGSANNYRSTQDGSAATRPQLIVTYTLPDTTIVLQPGFGSSQDTFIYEASPTFNYGFRTEIYVGRSGDNLKRHGLVAFDLSSVQANIPAGYALQSATLSLYCIAETNTANRTVSVHRGLNSWYAGQTDNAVPQTGINSSTWNLRNTNGSTAWSGGAGGAAGSDYVATPTDSVSITAPSTTFNFNVFNDVIGFLNASYTNHGWWLLNEEIINSLKTFVSSEYATAANRPKLTLVFALQTLEGTLAGTSTVQGTLSNATGPNVIATYQPDGAAGKDTTISQASPNSNFGINQYMSVGAAGATKALIEFDLSDIPTNALIVSAQLTLWNNTPNGVPHTVTIHRSLVQWFEGNQVQGTTTTDGSTWNWRNHIGSVAWLGGAGGDEEDDYLDAATDSQVIDGQDFYTWNVAADIQYFIANEENNNNGWWLLGDGTLDFAASENTTAARRPELVVAYIVSEIESSIAGSSTTTATGQLVGHLRSTLGGQASIEAIASSNEYVEALIEGEVSVYAHLVGHVEVAGSIAGQASLQIELHAGGYLRAELNGLATVTPTMRTNEWLTTTLEGTATVSGTIRAAGYARSTIANTSVVSGTMHADGWLAGSSDGVAVLFPRLTGNGFISATIAGTSTVVGDSEFLGRLRSQIHGTSTVVASIFGKYIRYTTAVVCNTEPLLYITNGALLPNGQLDKLNLLEPKMGFLLKDWFPAVAAYKDGGYFSSSVLADGRSLKRRVFENTVEVLTLSLRATSQDQAIRFTREYFRWQELAADYWTADWTTEPVYLVARSPKETNTRYAVIHVMSMPALANPYSQPFFSQNRYVAAENLALRIEREPWTDLPPGEFEAVALSSIRSWTVAGWESS